jgi:hypothetical protein
MSATIRVACAVSMMGGIGVAVAVAWIGAGYALRSNGGVDEWFHWLTPLVPPLVVIVGIAAMIA